MKISKLAGRKLILQLASLLLIVLVGDYITDRSFPHHWIVYVIAGGLLLILLVAYRTFGPDT